jgi:hypothetical protein
LVVSIIAEILIFIEGANALSATDADQRRAGRNSPALQL